MAKKYGICALCKAPHFLNHADLCKRCNASEKSTVYKQKRLQNEEKMHELAMKEAAHEEAMKKEAEATQEKPAEESSEEPVEEEEKKE